MFKFMEFIEAMELYEQLMFILFMEEGILVFIEDMELFMPERLLILFICWIAPWFMPTGDPRFGCMGKASCAFISGPFIDGWQGLPSLTNTGTATLRGEGRGFKSKPFSARDRFNLYLWFWNQIFTCVGVNLIILARCSRSGADKYLCCRNLLSNSYVCAFENKTLLLRFFWLSEFCCEPWELPLSLFWSQSSKLLVSVLTTVIPLLAVEWVSVDDISLEWLEFPGEFRCDRPTMKTTLYVFITYEFHYQLIKKVIMQKSKGQCMKTEIFTFSMRMATLLQ